MKRILSVLLLLATTLWVGKASADPVDEGTALRVAYNYCKMQGTNDLKLVNISSAMPYREFYTFVGEDGKGFVLVSANDCVLPILGFSADERFDTDDMPIHVQEWLEDY